MSTKAVKLDVYRTAIPMRGFEHAAARRELAEAVVVRLELSDGPTPRVRWGPVVGWGETHPRAYVTGETIDSVLADLRAVIWPVLAGMELRPGELPEIPATDAAGRCINAAACAVELAAADALMGPEDWAHLGQGGQGAGGGALPVRVSGVIGSAEPAKTARRLRWMRWFGLRDFKLKLGFSDEVDRANLAAVRRRIGKRLARGKCTLRVDVNGAWSADQTPQRLAELRRWGVCAVEQPVFGPAVELANLAERCELPLIADESLVTMADAQTLLAAGEGQKVWWNVRISKNGGLARSLALADLAAERGVPLVVGCMVGESSILSAAQRRLLAACPSPRFVEGNYGRFLLRDDLVRRSLRFGYGGRLKRLCGGGLGMRVDESKLARLGVLVESLGAV